MHRQRTPQPSSAPSIHPFITAMACAHRAVSCVRDCTSLCVCVRLRASIIYGREIRLSILLIAVLLHCSECALLRRIFSSCFHESVLINIKLPAADGCLCMYACVCVCVCVVRDAQEITYDKGQFCSAKEITSPQISGRCAGMFCGFPCRGVQKKGRKAK